MDHEELLGNTLKEIAKEKSGILKSNTTAIFSKQNIVALNVLKERAKELNCRTIIQNEDFQEKVKDSSILYSNPKNKIVLPMPKLPGHHQVENASVAITALQELGCNVMHFNDAMQKVCWPGRLQKITTGKISPMNLGFEAELFLDGGHNPSAGIAISNWINQLQPSNFYLILGIMKNKDLKGFLKPLAPKINKLIAIKIPNEFNAQEPEYITKISTELEITSTIAENIKDALHYISNEDTALPKRILIGGSLYLVGEFLKLNST